MPLQKILFKPGVNRENTRYTTEGGWYDCDKIRFRQGTPEKIGGWVQISEYTYSGVCRSLWSWSTLGSVLLTGVGTNEKFYIEEGGYYNDITPIRAYATLSNPFVAIAPQTFTVTVADPTVLTASSLATITNGMAFTFTTTGSLPTGLTTGVTYYAVNSASNTCQLALIPGGAPILTTGTQSGTHTLTSPTVTVTDASHGAADGDYVTFMGAASLSQQTFTRSSATNFVLTSALADNTPVTVYTSSGGSLPTGLTEGAVYYINLVSGTTVQFTNVPDGAAISTTTAGSGTFYISVNEGITASALNNTFKITYVDQNTFTIETSNAATAYDTGGGGTTVNTTYEIPIGYSIALALSGWGAGPWGTGAWGIGTAGTGNLRLWYQDNFGQDLIFGYSGGPMYYWTPTIGTSPLAITPTINSQTVSAVNTATEYITFSSVTGISDGTPVKFSSTTSLPSPLVAGTVYYIINLGGGGSAATAQLASTANGSAINLTTTGSGTITMYTPTLFTVVGSIIENTAVVLDSNGVVPTGMAIGTTYYVVGSTGPTFYLSATPQGDKIVATAAGSGTTYILPNGIPLTSLAYATNAPTATNFMLVSDVSRFVIAFGCTPIGETDINPMFVRWSDQESATNWDPQVTNQAGGQLLSSGSYLVTAVQTRQEIVVFSDSALYSMQYLGAPYVWGFQLMGDNISIASPNVVSFASGVVYWMGNDKFYKYDGRLQTLRCDLRQYIFSDINLLQSDQFFSGTNEGFNEVWWFYCSLTGADGNGTAATPNTVVDRYVVYNYAEDIWYYGTLGRTAWLDVGINEAPIAATYVNNIVEHEVGYDDNTLAETLPITSYISSSEFDIGDGHNFGFVWRMIPDITFRNSTADSPNVTMTLLPLQNSGSGYNVPQSEGGVSSATVTQITRPTSVVVEEFTGQVYIRVRGRQMTFRVDSTDEGVAWQLGAPRIDIKPDGRR